MTVQKIFRCSDCGFEIIRWVEPRINQVLEWCSQCNQPRWFRWEQPETEYRRSKREGSKQTASAEAT